MKEWGEEIEGGEKKENTSLMELVFNFGNLFSEGFLSPRPTSFYTHLKSKRTAVFQGFMVQMR